MDNLDQLAHEVYGRPAHVREYVGGSNAGILLDAAVLIRDLRLQLALAREDAASKPPENACGKELPTVTPVYFPHRITNSAGDNPA